MSEKMEEAHIENRSGRRVWIGIAIVTVLILAGLSWAARVFVVPSPPDTPAIADLSSERLLSVGNIVGFAAAHETHAWLGIPYAQPPVGPLRWRAPRPADPWVDTFDALALGRPCVQVASPIGGVPAETPDGLAGAEDCLTLNVWTPRREQGELADADLLPVLFWIHGGGNTRGYAGSSMYDGARLAGTEGLVVVSANYRLGPFGWFSHPALRREASSPIEASGNFGTLDQILALEWVASHIEEFGGDPDNVTIMGESAGATNVFALMLSPPARGLFHRAIAQSGSTDSISRDEAEAVAGANSPGLETSSAEVVGELIEASGLVPDHDAALRYAEGMSDVDLLEFLRGRSAEEVLTVLRRPDGPRDIEYPTRIRDGVVLPERPWLELIREGRFTRVPVLVGNTRDEERVFLSQDERFVSRYFGLLYRIRDRVDYERRANYHSELWAVRGTRDPANAFVDGGVRDVFGYRFDWDDWPSVLGQDMSVLLGASHGFELPFVFGTYDLGDPLFSRLLFVDETLAARESLSRSMMGYWAHFARFGRPGRGGGEGAPEWERWSHEGPGHRVLVFDDEGGGGLRMQGLPVGRARVAAAVARDDSLSADQKCELVIDLFGRRKESMQKLGARRAEFGC